MGSGGSFINRSCEAASVEIYSIGSGLDMGMGIHWNG
jgi:hypothetical protein